MEELLSLPTTIDTNDLKISHFQAIHLLVREMMTSSNGNIFRVTGHLCGEFTGPRWIPHKKARDTELWYFYLICARISEWVNSGEAGDLRRHRGHYDVIVMENPHPKLPVVEMIFGNDNLLLFTRRYAWRIYTIYRQIIRQYICGHAIFLLRIFGFMAWTVSFLITTMLQTNAIVTHWGYIMLQVYLLLQHKNKDEQSGCNFA